MLALCIIHSGSNVGIVSISGRSAFRSIAERPATPRLARRRFTDDRASRQRCLNSGVDDRPAMPTTTGVNHTRLRPRSTTLSV